MHKALAVNQPLLSSSWRGFCWNSPRILKRRRHALHRRCMKALAVESSQHSKRSSAQVQRLFEHRVKYRRELAGRGVDDPQHLGGGGLLFQGLARLGDEARVLHRDDRLRREVLQQRDLLVGKPADFLAKHVNRAEKRLVFAESEQEPRPDSSYPDVLANLW